MLPVPPAGCADVWWLDIGTVTVGRPELAELSLDEHKRAASFAFRSDRRRYTAAHVMLRRVLSGYVDIPPSSLIFRREPCPRCGKPTGRPALPFGYGLHFSLAHSGDAVVIAVAGQQVGVDVEQQPTGCVCALSADMNAADAEAGRPLDEPARHPGQGSDAGHDQRQDEDDVPENVVRRVRLLPRAGAEPTGGREEELRQDGQQQQGRRSQEHSSHRGHRL